MPNHSNSSTGAAPAAQAAAEAVVLLNFGGPRNLGEVRTFLFEILRDPHTLQVPVPAWAQDVLAWLITRRRHREVSRQYGEIGGRSPIVAATDAIASALERELAGRAGSAAPRSSALRVYVAHRYLRGHAAQTAARLVADGMQRVLAVPLYPHFSFATTGSSLEQLSQALRRAGFGGVLDALRSYPDAPGYLDALAERLRAAVAAAGLLPSEALPMDAPVGAALLSKTLPPRTLPLSTLPPAKLPPGTLILCSAHGLPAAYVERGDPYPLELRRSLAGLRRAFPEWEFELSFQSRVGPARWLEPYTDRILAHLAARGVKQLFFLPLSFVNDHLETLYEIGHTYVRAAQRLGMAAYRVPAVEDHPALVRELAQAIADWRQGLAGVPAGELLPPDQWARRVGWWLWTIWLAAFSATLAWACSR